MKADPHTKASHVGLTILISFVLVTGMNIIFEDTTVVGRAGETPSEAVEVASSLPVCQGGDISRLADDDRYGNCAAVADVVTNYVERSGLRATGVDPLSILMLIYAETACQTREQMEQRAMELSGEQRRRLLFNARGGLMQVDRPCLLGTQDNPDPCPTTEINVDYGTRVLKRNFDRTLHEGFTGRDAYLITWFGYNRGSGTQDMAMRLMRDEGKTIQEATDLACQHYFGHPDGTCGVAECSGGPHCRDGKRCDYEFYCRIRNPQVGVHYADRIWTTYEQACSTVGGRIVDGGSPSIGSSARPPGLGSDIAGENVIVGDYTINPAFRVSIEYDIDDYMALQEAVFGDVGLIARIEGCERRGDPIVACIGSALEHLNIESSTLNDARMTLIEGPCDPEENIKSDLVEGYLDCAASEDSACVCAVRLGQAPQNDKIPVQITLTKDQEAQPGRDIESQIDAIATHAVRGLDGTARFFEHDQIQIGVPPDGKDITLYKAQDTLYVVQDESASSERTCAMQKRTFKFCARKEGIALWRLDDGRPIRQSPQYKFALTFPDVTPPPAMTGIRVQDAPFSQNALLVQWDKSPADDAAEYDILFAPATQEPFSGPHDIALLRAKLDDVRAGPRTMRMRRYESSFPTSCTTDWMQGQCVYELAGGQEVALEEGILYEFDDRIQTKMVMVLRVLRDTTYHVGVLAADASGNVIDTALVQVPFASGSSRDDLAPMPVRMIRLEGTGAAADEWRITWDRPTRNADSSISDDIEGFHIYQETEMTEGIEDLGRSEPVRHLTLAQAGCAGDDVVCETTITLPSGEYVSIAAADDDGNVALAPVLFAPASAGEHLLQMETDDRAEEERIAAMPQAAIAAGRRVGIIGSSWVADGRFARALAEHCPEYTFEKHGYPGQGTASHLSHFDEDILANRYDQAVIVTTINDLDNQARSMEDIKNNLAQMYRRASDAGMRVIATTVFPWQGYGEDRLDASQREFRRRRTQDLNIWLLTPPPGVGAVVDARDALANPDRPDYMNPGYTSDGAHMNAQGNRALGEEIFEQAFRGQEGCDE